MARILVVDDDPLAAKAAARVLRQHQVCVATAMEALELLKDEDFDVIVSDVDMPVLSGPDLLASVRPQLAPRFVFYSGGSLGVTRSKLASLPNQTLPKPYAPEELLAAVARCMSGDARKAIPKMGGR